MNVIVGNHTSHDFGEHYSVDTISIQKNKKDYGSHFTACKYCKSDENLKLMDYYYDIDPHQTRHTQAFCSCNKAKRYGTNYFDWEKP